VWKTETVNAWEHALLYVNGTFRKALPAGRYTFLTFGKRVQVHRMPAYPLYFPTQTIDVVSADRFALRLGVAVFAQICDPRTAVETQNQYGQKLMIAMTEAAATAAAERTLEALFSDRKGLGEAVRDQLSGKIAELEIQAVTITTVIAPPEIRRMLTEVERARHEGAAALERARSEQAALRSLANAARLLKDNPDLMRLRTLQALSPTGKGATLVLGQDAIAAPKPG
jgi:regulator of protease activity HflC (stomatin/prohibitin superfamily)